MLLNVGYQETSACWRMTSIGSFVACPERRDRGWIADKQFPSQNGLANGSVEWKPWMTKQVDWHWGVSNAGQSTLFLWLEPWADEVEVPPGATATLRIVSLAAQPVSLEIEDTGEHVVIWAAGGDCVEVYVDGVLQRTGSASIPVPDGFGSSTKGLLGVMFDNQPKARLAGQQPTAEPLSLWRRLKRYVR